MVHPRVTPAPWHTPAPGASRSASGTAISVGDVLLPPDHCGQTPVICRRTQSSITKYVPSTELSPAPGAELAHLVMTSVRPPRTHTFKHAEHQGPAVLEALPIDCTEHRNTICRWTHLPLQPHRPPAEDAPSGLAGCIPDISPRALRCVLAVQSVRAAVRAPVRPRVRQGCHPRTCQALRVRLRRSEGPDHQAAPSPSLLRTPRGSSPSLRESQSL